MSYKVINYNGEPKTLKGLCKLLENGALFIVQTDTQIGLVSVNKDAVYKIKRRPLDKKLIFFLPTNYEFENLTLKQRMFLKKFWPGPVSVVHKGYCYRKPNAPRLMEIIDKLGIPVLCTSANISGKPTPTNLIEAAVQFEPHNFNIDIIITSDQPLNASNVSSTIIDLKDWKILREGSMADEIKAFLDGYKIYN